MIVKRRQVAPRKIAGDELHDAGEEQKAENEPTIQPDLDGGSATSFYSPESGRKGNLVPLGPMIGVYERAN